MIQQMEAISISVQAGGDNNQPTTIVADFPDTSADVLSPSAPKNCRSNTPLASDGEETVNADLSVLETALQVKMSSESQLPHFVTSSQVQETAANDSPPQTDNDNISLVCDAPSLPGGECKVRYLAGQSEDDGGAKQSSLGIPDALYGRHPFSHLSETEGRDDTGSDVQVPGTSGNPTTSATARGEPPNLSGRSRAILKEYFDESPLVRLPVGQTSVLFTEPQVYQLLRVLTDETLSRSFTTMERMVIDAVRGAPAVAPSCTAHFHSRGRAQTPGPGVTSDSSESEIDNEAMTTVRLREYSDSAGAGNSSYYEENDSATEMALITKSFKETQNTPGLVLTTEATPAEPQAANTDTMEQSSQDTTLLEIKEQARQANTARPSKSKKRKSTKKYIRRGVPMREELFSKIGWTRSFISGPADPLHNPHMV